MRTTKKLIATALILVLFAGVAFAAGQQGSGTAGGGGGGGTPVRGTRPRNEPRYFNGHLWGGPPP
ncbi:MAG: hypothetical protein LBL19_01615, partial [Spirochaetaceae bacterium]|nr:hypothetical protein [Spirochaetaceae bacterium]